ncbi:hypothetical protein [Natrinema pallidum]|uniref:Uncharacterized protein n=1 Tax=Natrinema pallidum DSM 3751 TaxID=1227495 RepID=L9YQW9_9EURY|nr:hypothetical protein [Natrinema pallidum]ELY76615.1 hypothetical protein C487_11042 [Natrinema pallidum DSM 3751]
MVLQKATRALSIVTVCAFTVAIGGHVTALEPSQSGLLFYATILALAYVGLVDLLVGVDWLAVACGVVLLVLGVREFSLFPYLAPTGMVLIVDGIGSAVPSPVGVTADESP